MIQALSAFRSAKRGSDKQMPLQPGDKLGPWPGSFFTMLLATRPWLQGVSHEAVTLKRPIRY